MNDIVVVLPGIMGSILQKDKKDAFGLTASAGLRAVFSGGRSITDLRVDLQAAPGQRPDDGVTAARIAPDAHLIPGLWKIDGYGKVGNFLQERLGVVSGESYFEFPYDWRLDNRIAAADLSDALNVWLSRRRTTYPDAKVILVAHSMGGLVSRYCLDVLDGWRDTRALITFGTPHRGSLDALNFVANGFRSAFGLVDLSDLVRSFPSVYQLLPIYPCIEVGGEQPAYLSDVAELLPNVNAEAVRAARMFHQEIEDAVARNKQLGEYGEHGYRLLSVTSIEHPTNQLAVLNNGELTMLKTHPWTETGGGDGTVPGVAASPMEAQDNSDWPPTMFAGTRHSSLQNAAAVLTQVKGWLTPSRPTRFRAGGSVRLAVDMEDAFASNEPVTVRVTPSSATSEIRYQLEQIARPGQDNGDPPMRQIAGEVPAVDGTTEIEITVAEPGLYRLILSGGDDVEPVSDLVVVAPR